MEENEAVRELMAKLMAAVEASLSGSTAVREALAELGRNGYEARLFFVANAESQGDGDGEAMEGDVDAEDEAPVLHEIGATADDGDLRFDLTKLDRDFLKSLHIRPEGS
jgi:hypothetical protein